MFKKNQCFWFVQNLLATNHAVYQSILSFDLCLILKTHLLPMAYFPFGSSIRIQVPFFNNELYFSFVACFHNEPSSFPKALELLGAHPWSLCMCSLEDSKVFAWCKKISFEMLSFQMIPWLLVVPLPLQLSSLLQIEFLHVVEKCCYYLHTMVNLMWCHYQVQ
jgi:hypothetical protein